MDRPSKRAKLLSDDESDGEQGIRLEEAGKKNGFKVNEEYARRFEHNKKREEKDRLEEKYGGKNSQNGSLKGPHEDEEDEDTEDSEDESEDDNAELATEHVDDEIFDTLNAIKNKDPRVYDQNVKFYKEYNPEESAASGGAAKKEKPMYLQDYHRQNLLSGHTGADDDNDAPPRTYQEEQDAMKRDLVGSMHATANGEAEYEAGSEEEDDLLVTKSKPKHSDVPSTQKKSTQITDKDIAAADKDPETYLSNFMAARAWLPNETSRWQAFDSDDSEDEKRAEEFEDAFNMRFEDPKNANEKLQSFARDVGKYSVRRDEKKSARQRGRDREREQKEAAKRERDEEKARLRKLKIEEAEEKVRRIKHAAGMQGKELNVDDWKDVIEGDFDDERWEEEMKRRFGEEYYAAPDALGGSEDEDENAETKKSQKMKKPKWDDDIDIKDLVPEFEDEDQSKPAFTLSDEEDEEGDVSTMQPGEGSPDEAEEPESGKKRKTKKDRAKEKSEAKRTARRERRQIEDLVDTALPVDQAPAAPGFRYRETSPTNFGLSARDILFADDSQLNQYAGLKKLTGWRDEEKKRKDKKKFSKKGRLREWRKEVFGNKDEPQGGFERVLGGRVEKENPSEDVGEKAKKKRKRKGAKKDSAASEGKTES